MKLDKTRKSQVYTTPLSITSQITFCGLPLRLDSYAGCAFRCTYCFARYRGGNTSGDNVRPADHKKINRTFNLALNDDSFPVGIIGQFLRHRVPIHFGGMSDPFQPAELRYRVSESFLRILADYDYPTVISTKSDLVISEPYFSLLREMKHVVVQFSFSTTIDEIANRIEPFSVSPTKLMQCMEKLTKAGVKVTCRWQPFIPNVSESPSEFVPRIALTGCKHIGLEHLKLPVERHHPLWDKLMKGVNRDIYKEYRVLGAHLDGREFILPTQVKLPSVLKTADLCKRHELSFGAADNELQYLSDTDCCCCGVDQFPGFENWYKYQIGYAVRKCRGKEISFDSISQEWHPFGSIDRYLNSNSRLSRTGNSKGSVTDHILAKWNNPLSPGSPASFFGVASTNETVAGNRIYKWKAAEIGCTH